MGQFREHAWSRKAPRRPSPDPCASYGCRLPWVQDTNLDVRQPPRGLPREGKRRLCEEVAAEASKPERIERTPLNRNRDPRLEQRERFDGAPRVQMARADLRPPAP